MTKTARILATALIVALAAPAAIAGSDAKQRFVHDGQTYVYTATEKNGHTILEGRRYPSGSAFRLIVSGGAVTGTAGGTPVAFTVAEARGATKPVQIATAD